MFGIIDEQILIHYYELKPVDYITHHSSCCTFCGLRQLYNYVHPLVQCLTEQFHLPEQSLCSTPFTPTPAPKALATAHPCYCSHSWAFSIMLYSWNHAVCSEVSHKVVDSGNDPWPLQHHPWTQILLQAGWDCRTHPTLQQLKGVRKTECVYLETVHMSEGVLGQPMLFTYWQTYTHTREGTSILIGHFKLK